MEEWKKIYRPYWIRKGALKTGKAGGEKTGAKLGRIGGDS